ncbi:TatD family hydrolase [uncultured Desulfuromusa sp.]|uniref:TatD family hydrolase n=1 Tax=uncultured Desulfuromusa sp. TaxID=219183 RepID=UPI002AA85C6C|nr:TatD family hydrolase [uncultured Desulfuromusa sp.]
MARDFLNRMCHAEFRLHIRLFLSLLLRFCYHVLMFSLVDTHIHLDAPELKGYGLDLLPRALQGGISRFIVPGVRVSGWGGMSALAENSESVYLAPGLHPVYADQWNSQAEQTLLEIVQQRKVVAIGEIGLDAVDGPSMKQQEKVLKAQLQIALEMNLPVLMHSRQTTGKLLDVLRECGIGRKTGGIWHAFTSSLPVAEELVDMGFKIGVGPILLRENARKLPQAVKALPASALVLETDLPDMAEKPEVLLQVAEKIAELRGCPVREVAEFTTENAEQLFRFQD